MPSNKTSALVLFAHGAREPGWAEPFRSVRDKVAASRPDLSVELAFLELMSPALGDCVDGLAAAGHERITVAPLFLAMGGHLKDDLPNVVAQIRATYKDMEINVEPPIGEQPGVIAAIARAIAK